MILPTVEIIIDGRGYPAFVAVVSSGDGKAYWQLFDLAGMVVRHGSSDGWDGGTGCAVLAERDAKRAARLILDSRRGGDHG